MCPSSGSQVFKFQLACPHPQHLQYGEMGRLNISFHDLGRAEPVRFLKKSSDTESSDEEFGILEDERCINTGVFQERYFLQELVFACSNSLPRQPQISFTFMTQADWCAARTVARCEAGLLPVLGTMGGARVVL